MLLQDNLHMMVPCMLMVLADLSDYQPALAGRLKAAAMQLLPPVLDGLHARRPAGQPDRGGSAEHLQQWSLASDWVCTKQHLGVKLCCCAEAFWGRLRIRIVSACAAQGDTQTRWCLVSASIALTLCEQLSAHGQLYLANAIASTMSAACELEHQTQCLVERTMTKAKGLVLLDAPFGCRSASRL